MKPLDRVDNHYDAQDDTLGGRISFARDSASLSLEEAASQLGVTAQAWADWECDRASPESYKMPRLTGVLHISLRWLMTGAGPGPTLSLLPSGADELRKKLQSAAVEVVSAQNRVQRLLTCLAHEPDRTSDNSTLRRFRTLGIQNRSGKGTMPHLSEQKI